VGAGELHAEARTPEPLDCLAIEALGLVAFDEERPTASLDPEPPVGAGSAGRLGDWLERSGRALGLSGPDGRLDQLG
jgi:hypothetical protein